MQSPHRDDRSFRISERRESYNDEELANLWKISSRVTTKRTSYCLKCQSKIDTPIENESID